MTKSELLKKLRELHKLQQKSKALKEKVSGLKDEIKAEMTEQEIKKMQVGEIKVSCTKYVTHRFNTESFKAKFGYLYESYLKEVQATRFTLTKKEKATTKKLIKKVDGNGFDVARENLKMLETCGRKEELIALLNTTTKEVLGYMAIEISKEHWGYEKWKKPELVEFVVDKFLASKAEIAKFEVGKSYLFGFGDAFKVVNRTDNEVWIEIAFFVDKCEIEIDPEEKCEKIKYDDITGVTGVKATDIASDEFLAKKQEAIEKAERAEQEMLRQMKRAEAMSWGYLETREFYTRLRAKKFQSYLKPKVLYQ